MTEDNEPLPFDKVLEGVLKAQVPDRTKPPAPTTELPVTPPPEQPPATTPGANPTAARKAAKEYRRDSGGDTSKGSGRT